MSTLKDTLLAEKARREGSSGGGLQGLLGGIARFGARAGANLLNTGANTVEAIVDSNEKSGNPLTGALKGAANALAGEVTVPLDLAAAAAPETAASVRNFVAPALGALGRGYNNVLDVIPDEQARETVDSALQAGGALTGAQATGRLRKAGADVAEEFAPKLGKLGRDFGDTIVDTTSRATEGATGGLRNGVEYARSWGTSPYAPAANAEKLFGIVDEIPVNQILEGKKVDPVSGELVASGKSGSQTAYDNALNTMYRWNKDDINLTKKFEDTDPLRYYLNARSQIAEHMDNLADAAGAGAMSSRDLTDLATRIDSLPSQTKAFSGDPRVAQIVQGYQSRIFQQAARADQGVQTSLRDLRNLSSELSSELSGIATRRRQGMANTAEQNAVLEIKKLVDETIEQKMLALDGNVNLGEAYKALRGDYANLKMIEKNLIKAYKRAVKGDKNLMELVGDAIESPGALFSVLSGSPAVMAGAVAARVGVKIFGGAMDTKRLNQVFKQLRRNYEIPTAQVNKIRKNGGIGDAGQMINPDTPLLSE